MKVLIIEDEKNAFDYLSSLLNRANPQVEIEDQLESVEEAVNWFSEDKKIDLVFLDIELSDGLSFEIFQHVEVKAPIIFTTAYDQYAIEAFKVNSIGYLLKPINQMELNLALEKYEKYRPKDLEAFSSQLKSIFGEGQKVKKQRCLVKKSNHFEFIQIKDIAFVHSDQGLTFLYTFKGERHVYNNTVEGLYHELDEEQFFQINRGQIININAIKKIHPYFNYRMKLELQNNKMDIEFLVSRSKLPDFKVWLDG
ncbi:MAG: LytTR family DNA-binding domain-containing protein [Bacteroidota bacterium]